MAAPAPPIVVAIPPLLVGPEVIVTLDANEQWYWPPPVSGGSRRLQSLALRRKCEHRLVVCCVASFAKCSRSQDPLTFAAARTLDIFDFVLSAAAWSRVLSELRDSGLFLRPFTRNCDTWRQRLDSLVPQNPALLVLLAADFLAMPPFNPAPVIAPAGAGGRGRGRGRAAAVGVPVPLAAAGGGGK